MDKNKIIKRIMSNLYWKERKKGNSHKKALINVRKKSIPLKIKNPYGNYDGDNKINKYDCQPKNKWKQDNESFENKIKKNREEWNKLDIYQKAYRKEENYNPKIELEINAKKGVLTKELRKLIKDRK